MKQITTSLALLFFLSVNAQQVFNGTGGSITNNGVPTTFKLNVSGLSGQLDHTFGLVEVCLDITHPDMQEISISLLSPSGMIVELANGASQDGTNFTGTCFNHASGTSITKGTAPYSGSFKPMGYLGRFNAAKPGNGEWKLFVKDYLNNPNAGTLNSWSLKFGPSPAAPVTFTSSNLPIVFVNTNNQTISTNSILVTIGIVDNGGASRNHVTDSWNHFSGKAEFHFRGSSSLIFEKKSFKIDLVTDAGLPNNVSLLGMPAESDWVLTASYSDKTFIRNPLTMHLFRQMGHYGARSRYVELVINNEYQGLYILTEKPKRNFQRVDVARITSIDNTFPNITGGYIIQIDRTDEPGWYSKFPGISTSGAKFYYQYSYPKPEEITPTQKSYIQNVLDTFETVLNGPDFANPVTGYRKYANVETFIDLLIINELSKNADGYKLSTYLYKDHILDGGKLNAGPVWDYDIAWHNCNYGNTFSEQWWQWEQPENTNPSPTWWQKMVTDPYFKDRLYCRYHTLRKNALSNASINAYIDQCAEEIAEAQARNFTQYPIMNAYVFPNPVEQQGPDYNAVVADLKSWVAKRSAWMDSNIPGFCNSVSLAENSESGGIIGAFPNPFTQNLYLRYHTSGSTSVKAELFNMVGSRMVSVEKNTGMAGEFEEDIDTKDLPAGTYLLKLTIDNREFYKKIIKTQNQ